MIFSCVAVLPFFSPIGGEQVKVCLHVRGMSQSAILAESEVELVSPFLFSTAYTKSITGASASLEISETL